MAEPTKNEQLLVDLIYEFAMNAKGFPHDTSNEKIADWVSKNLDTLGFEGHPAGLKWRKLTKVRDEQR